MAKPKKRRKANRKGSLPEIPLEILAIEGDKFLGSGNFVKAVSVFKRLLKSEPCRQWQEKLAKAYLGRARGLFAKGMTKEALAILDNLAHFCPETTPDESLLPFKIELLIGAGRLEKAADLYRRNAEHLKGTTAGTALEELFAALCLAGEEILLKALPEESPIVAHYPFASEALRAYCRQEDTGANQALKQIPFRSPYKHFALALKGLLTLSSDLAGAARIFAKIPQSSPFYALIGPTACCLQSDQPLAAILNEMGRTDLQRLACIRGFDEKRLTVLLGLFRAQNQPQKQLALLCSQGKELDAKWARQTSLALLPFYPRGEKIYDKAFGRLPNPERIRLQALALEQFNDWVPALDYWQIYVEKLAETPQTAQRDLSIALVYRHLAEIADKHFDTLEDECSGYLGKSLAYDPVDKPTYQKLFDACRNDKKALRKWLDPALEHFPEDIDILLTAAEAALDGNAFKKTSRYAAKILKLDPINTRVRELLLRAHLAHGRKLAKSGKFELADKEFILAGTQQRSEAHKGASLICQGLLKILEKAEQQGQTLIEAGQQLVGLPCQAWLITAVEAALMGLPQGKRNRINRQLKACNKVKLNKIEFYRLLEQIKSYQIQAAEVMKKLNGPLQPLLKESADLGFSQEESRALCDDFYQQRRFDLLQPFATVAEKHWPDQPIFTFYRLYAKVAGFPENLSKKDLNFLEQAKGEAMDRDDFYVADLIAEFLDFFPFAPPFSPGESPEFNPRRVIEALLGALGGEGGDEPFPFKKPKKAKKKPKKAKKKTIKGKTDPFEQLELF